MKEIIFDTDFGADCDDTMALAYLIYAEKYLDARIKAITFSNGNADGIAAIRAFVRDLGREAIPVGAPARAVPSYDVYCKKLAERFGDESDRRPAENAVSVIRRALADSDSAIICGVGASTNIAALLENCAMVLVVIGSARYCFSARCCLMSASTRSAAVQCTLSSLR